MWTGDTSRISHQPDHLCALHGITKRNEWFAEMEIGGNYSAAVVDVNHVAGQKEVVDEDDHPAIGRAHRLADSAPEVDAQVTCC